MRGQLSIVYAIPLAAAVLLVPAAAAPLALYTLTLAAFGLPHVLSELRYVDRRFGRGIAPPVLLRLLVLLLLIAGARSATVFHLISARVGVPLELAGVVLLALNVATGSLTRRLAASSVALAIGAATLASPYETAVTFSILHNLTPLGFLWQILPDARRKPAMLAASVGFVGLPLLVASGLPRMALAGAGLTSLDPIGAGALASHLYVYVPRALLEGPQAIDLFSASALAQCEHYLAVIVVLPVLLQRIDPAARGLVPWPRGAWFYAGLAVAGALSFSVFARGFADARALYGIVASFHAWIEIPILILALTGVQPKNHSPAAEDAVLATSETSIAR